MSQQKLLLQRTGDTQENVSVALRIKPASDIQDKSYQILDEKRIKIRKSNEICQFDNVFPETCDSRDIFQTSLQSMVDRFIQGTNGSICAYGQTSSGKTYTMKGNKENPGLIPLTLEYLFNYFSQQTNSLYHLKVAYVELYNEVLYDLLSPNRNSIEIRENTQGKPGVQLVDVKQDLVCSFSAFQELLQQHHIIFIRHSNYGEDQRQFGETKLNDSSSRSHVILQLSLESRSKRPPFTQNVSQLYLVDLAGSEAISKTQTEGIRRKEGCLINKSLLALQNVVKQLKENQSKINKYVNVRDSKLTRLLSNSLCGSSLNIFLLTINQQPDNIQESLNTIRFGMVAGAIKTSIRNTSQQEEIDQNFCDTDKIEMMAQALQMKQQIESLEEENQKAILTGEQLGIRNSQLQAEQQKLIQQINHLDQQISDLQLKNTQLSSSQTQFQNKYLEQLKVNEEINQQLRSYVKFTQETGLYKQQLQNAQTQTIEFNPAEYINLELKERVLNLEGQIQIREKQVEEQSKQLKESKVVFQREIQDINQLIKTTCTPRKQKYQSDFEDQNKNDNVSQWVLKSLQKNSEYLDALSLATEVQCELLQKAKEILLLKKAIDEKDKVNRIKDEQIFSLKQQLLDTPSYSKMESTSKNFMNQNAGQKKRIINSPTKEELKKTVVRHELRNQQFMKELERYKKNIDAIVKDKENLQAFSHKLYKTLAENKIQLSFTDL